MFLKHRINRFFKTQGHNLYWFQDSFRRKLRYRKRIKRWMKYNSKIRLVKKDYQYLAESEKFLRKQFNGYRNTNWHIYYAAFNGIKDKHYIPEDLFFNEIEPTLNNFILYKAYTDKNSYDNFIDKNHLPKTLFKLINGEYFDENNVYTPEKEALEKLLSYKTELVLKPAIISGQGRNVNISSSEKIVSLLKTNGNYKNFSFIIQEKIQQHHKLSAFHPNSVNTYRITTLRINREIVVLHSVFRMGRKKNVVDNSYAGGIFCGISLKGDITEYACDIELKKMYEHPDSGIPFKNFICPSYREACDFCRKYHRKLLHFALVSWDIAIHQDGKPICIEMNLKNQSISGHQLIHGPLFGDYTGKILEQFRQNYGKNRMYY